MATESPAISRVFNPFVLPAETNARFLLLTVTAMMSALGAARCFERCLFSPTYNPFAGNNPARVVSGNTNLRADSSVTGPAAGSVAHPYRELSIQAGTISILLILSTLMYLAHSDINHVKERLAPFPKRDDPELHSELNVLIELSGVKPVPAVVAGNNRSSQVAQAFGFPWRYVIRLDRGMQLVFRKNRDLFRAKVLHELAHVANEDIGKSDFIDALWFLLTICLVMPLWLTLLLLLIWSQFTAFNLRRLLISSLPVFIVLHFQCMAAMHEAKTVHAQWLRIRELYADWRARLWGGGEALQALMWSSLTADRRPTLSTRTPPRLLHKRIIGFVNSKRAIYHPEIQKRLDCLRNPIELFEVKPDHAFHVGIALAWLTRGLAGLFAAVAPIVTNFARHGWLRAREDVAADRFGLLSQFGWHHESTLLTCVLLALFLNGVIGHQARREGLLASLSLKKRKEGLGPICSAFLLSFGLEIGFISWIGDFSSFSMAMFFADILWMLSVGFVLFWWLLFAEQFGLMWLGGHTGSEPPPRSTHRLLNFFAIATAAAVLFAALVSRQAFHGEISFDRGIDITKLVGETLGVFLLLLGTEFILSIFAGMVAPIRCRSCQGSMVAVHAVGKSCKYCDEDLTPWIFAPALSELITHPDLLSQSSDESNSSASGTPAIND